MEEALFRTMLFDSYGELLTEKQREYFDLHYNEDLSLAEIAQNEGVSRQSVWDIIRRAEETMRRFEEKTGWSRASPPSGTFSPRRRKSSRGSKP